MKRSAFLGLLGAAMTWAQPTFMRDIASIIYKDCVSCHRPGESAPFPLLTFEDVRKHAPQIAAVTANRYMPPWLPDQGDFEDDHRLTEAQIETIAEWVKAGAPEGDPAELPALPSSGHPDLILTASRPFTLPADGPDVFWNFVFTPNLTRGRYVRAIEIQPGTKQVHHANVIVDRMNIARADFPGMDIKVKYSVFDPPGHFLFWKPGGVPFSEADGSAWRLEPGNSLILNTHLQPSGKPEQIQPSIGLYFTDQPPKRFPLLIQLEHDGAINIPAGRHDVVGADDLRLPMDVDILAVYPHAHYLGKLLEAWATLPDGKREWLIRIPSWNPNWQAVYRYKEPLALPKGTVVSMRWHYDNTTSHRVQSGNNATDEMGHLWLQALPHDPRDRRRELEEAVMQHKVEKYPADWASWLDLGELRFSRLETQGALSAFETAVRLDPKQSQPHNLLGAALNRVGRFPDALNQFQTAVTLDSTNVNARYNLVLALIRASRFDEAEAHLHRVIAAVPNDAAPRNLAGELLMRAGRYTEAIKEFNAALELDPGFTAAKENRDLAIAHEPPPN